MNGRYRKISVIDPLNPALTRVEEILFCPFNLGKWFVIGFCAWLAFLGEGGGSGGHFNFGSGRHGDYEHFSNNAHAYWNENMFWIIPLAAVLILLSIVIGVLILWISSRGRFMFLHCVAQNKAEVKVPWHKYRAQANSLFFFRLVFGIVGAVIVLLIIGASAVGAIAAHANRAIPLMVLAIAIGILLLIPVIIVLAVIGKFTEDFVVPIMYRQTTGCLEGWSRFMSILTQHFGSFVLYLLFQIVLGMAIGMLVLAVIIVTCCIAGCILAIPYLGTVLLLPVLVFTRSYSLYFLRQFGPEFDVFPQNTQPPTGSVMPTPGTGPSY